MASLPGCSRAAHPLRNAGGGGLISAAGGL